MSKTLNWGIIGPGKIARKFAQALQRVPGCGLVAVGSRDLEKANQFAKEFGAKKSYGTYEALAADKEVDIVYVATPHTFHYAHSMLCLENGKSVLCEKPLSVDRKSALELTQAATAKGLFLMEAMWTRFLPLTQKIDELLAANTIGKPTYLRADFGFPAPFNPESRLYNLGLGGGAMLDIGVYPLFLALHVMGIPGGVISHSHLSETGSDIATSAILHYEDGKIADIHCSLNAQTPLTAEIAGPDGLIVIERPWYKANSLAIKRRDDSIVTIDVSYGDNGFEYQIQEAFQCIESGRKESLLLPHHFSILMAGIAEEITNRAGIKYVVQSL
ncbi:MAG: Gfo/Idh/MocA family oxidoreductase [Bacteroidota bacterium]|nr:Gfo/Idh/MocA family oxidoreductase [Bacteroidota bacterium]